MQDGVVYSTVKEEHRHDVCGHSSPGRFPFGFMKTRKTAYAYKGRIKATSTDHNISCSAPAFRTLGTTTRGRRAMRAFKDLSLARKRYHESIGRDKSRFPEGHSQVEYPTRASRHASRSCSAPPERFSPPTQVAPSTDPVKNESPVAEPKSPIQKSSPLVDIKPTAQQASASRYITRSGKHVEGYETHCSSSGTQKYKQRPQDIVTRKTWQKVWPTVIEHNPTTPDQVTNKDQSARGKGSRDSEMEAAGKGRET